MSTSSSPVSRPGGAPEPTPGPAAGAVPLARRSRRHLVGLLAVAVAGLFFAVLLVLVRTQWAPLESVDHGVAADLNKLIAPHAPLVKVVTVVTTLGSGGVLWWLIALGAIILLVRRRYRLAIFLPVAGVGSLILDPALKALVGRLRPVVADPIAHGNGNSFPSGHTLGSLIVYGALLLVFLPALRGAWRRTAIIGTAVLVLLIGISRILLGVHYLSDVVGGWCLGVFWLGLTGYAFELYRRGQGKAVPHPLVEGLDPESAPDVKPTDPPPGNDSGALRATAGAMVAFILAFGAVLGFGELVVRFGGKNLLGDSTIPHYLAAHRTPSLNSFSYFWSQAGNTHAIMAVGLIIGAVALGVIRRWRPVVFLVALMMGELGLFLGTAAIIGRERPDVPHLDSHLPTSSYPSGHVAATLCVWVALVLLVVPRTTAWWRWLTLIPAIGMPVLVIWARMYRGMHHPTDVLGSLLLAACWITALYLIVRPHKDLADGSARRSRAATQRAAEELEERARHPAAVA